MYILHETYLIDILLIALFIVFQYRNASPASMEEIIETVTNLIDRSGFLSRHAHMAIEGVL